MKTVLLTGLTGFIGRNVARAIFQKYQVTAIVRPNTDKKRYKEFIGKIEIVEIDLANSNMLIIFLSDKKYDFILHIGALRGGRKFDNDEYFKTNVTATEIMVNHSLKNYETKFILCSSVGVLGAIPTALPASATTPYKEDNFYHYTKIQCEKIVMKAVFKKGLKAIIIRPSITYGKGDYGFPYTLTKLVAKKLLLLPNEKFYIHLTNVQALIELFCNLLENSFETGSIVIVADKTRVCFQDLVDFISKEIHNDYYPKNRYLKKGAFNFFIKIAKLLKNELWTSRFELISNSWYYDVDQVYLKYDLQDYRTIPNFESVIEWYLSKN